MLSRWKKVKEALGCLLIPQTLHDDHQQTSTRLSDARNSPSSSNALRFSRSSSKSKEICTICQSMLKGQNGAIFVAECSHSFHFNCISSYTQLGNCICPICRKKWKEIPFQSQAPDPHGNLRGSLVAWPRDTSGLLQPLPVSHPVGSQLHVAEPDIFDDDDHIDQQNAVTVQRAQSATADRRVEITTIAEVSAICKAMSCNDFAVLIHMKAPVAETEDLSSVRGSQNSRAPLDLVTVLDVSGSMAGTKLVLLKRAMGFVIQNLGPLDRLSVIAFSGTARRLFPLRLMTNTGRQQALQAVNSLSSNGGTNIAEGLKKGLKVMLDRKEKNAVCSVIFLSDGQDTYTVYGAPGAQTDSLLPNSIERSLGTCLCIPVHTFGFGADHDAVLMHRISQYSGGTFSFIEAESSIQDAFAQCMGGLLSVVTQELKVEVQCLHPGLQLCPIKAGSYHAERTADGRIGYINIGDLYAEEERDFLVSMNIPEASVDEMSLLKVFCTYKDSITKVQTTSDEIEVKICRPETTVQPLVSIEVDRQRNRLKAAEAMSKAQSAADHHDLAAAISILKECCNALSESTSVKGNDPFCVGLVDELRETQLRMANLEVYEASGRAYVLSGMSSHSWQRAAARGDATSSTTFSQVYQTPAMANMITRSQTMISNGSSVRPPNSVLERPSPR